MRFCQFQRSLYSQIYLLVRCYSFRQNTERVRDKASVILASLGSLNTNWYHSWFPTITMTMEYKFTIPRPSKATPSHSNRTLGVFSSTSFLHGALGRHSSLTEVWTAPCDIGEAVEVAEGWQDDQVCLAVSTQMAVIVPMEKNLGRGKGKL
ncbi:hypothetical protein DFJ43DRAFT_167953 [Lentinula guzmanii]|uniref:Uncharacterized protein n=1 Tax=Lentinula guzmanii TaxID=2804957 RepID=A0AA38MV08_9AGAR|nr:hypothetical protein DFJ43DRAFT_167953 [Lentinula guzmanii]